MHMTEKAHSGMYISCATRRSICFQRRNSYSNIVNVWSRVCCNIMCMSCNMT